MRCSRVVRYDTLDIGARMKSARRKRRTGPEMPPDWGTPNINASAARKVAHHSL
jgi:hypothetical protein